MTHGQKTENEALDELLRRVQGEQVESTGTADLPEFPATSTPGQQRAPAAAEGLQEEILRALTLPVKVELGRKRLPLKEALGLAKGDVLALGKEAGDPVELVVKDIPIARGEVIVVDDRFCVRITELLTTPPESAGGE
jgi:flagellar motor switch protein FliN/FliY